MALAPFSWGLAPPVLLAFGLLAICVSAQPVSIPRDFLGVGAPNLPQGTRSSLASGVYLPNSTLLGSTGPYPTNQWWVPLVDSTTYNSGPDAADGFRSVSNSIKI